MDDSQERLRAAVDTLQRERRQALDAPSPKSATEPLDANRLVIYIVGGMVAIVAAGLMFYVLAHRVGFGWAIVILTSPGWGYGLYRVAGVLAVLYRARRELAAVRAEEVRLQQRVAVQCRLSVESVPPIISS